MSINLPVRVTITDSSLKGLTSSLQRAVNDVRVQIKKAPKIEVEVKEKSAFKSLLEDFKGTKKEMSRILDEFLKTQVKINFKANGLDSIKSDAEAAFKEAQKLAVKFGQELDDLENRQKALSTDVLGRKKKVKKSDEEELKQINLELKSKKTALDAALQATITAATKLATVENAIAENLKVAADKRTKSEQQISNFVNKLARAYDKVESGLLSQSAASELLTKVQDDIRGKIGRTARGLDEFRVANGQVAVEFERVTNAVKQFASIADSAGPLNDYRDAVLRAAKIVTSSSQVELSSKAANEALTKVRIAKEAAERANIQSDRNVETPSGQSVNLGEVERQLYDIYQSRLADEQRISADKKQTADTEKLTADSQKLLNKIQLEKIRVEELGKTYGSQYARLLGLQNQFQGKINDAAAAELAAALATAKTRSLAEEEAKQVVALGKEEKANIKKINDQRRKDEILLQRIGNYTQEILSKTVSELDVEKKILSFKREAANSYSRVTDALSDLEENARDLRLQGSLNETVQRLETAYRELYNNLIDERQAGKALAEAKRKLAALQVQPGSDLGETSGGQLYSVSSAQEELAELIRARANIAKENAAVDAKALATSQAQEKLSRIQLEYTRYGGNEQKRLNALIALESDYLGQIDETLARQLNAAKQQAVTAVQAEAAQELVLRNLEEDQKQAKALADARSKVNTAVQKQLNVLNAQAGEEGADKNISGLLNKYNTLLIANYDSLNDALKAELTEKVESLRAAVAISNAQKEQTQEQKRSADETEKEQRNFLKTLNDINKKELEIKSITDAVAAGAKGEVQARLRLQQIAAQTADSYAGVAQLAEEAQKQLPQLAIQADVNDIVGKLLIALRTITEDAKSLSPAQKTLLKATNDLAALRARAAESGIEAPSSGTAVFGGGKSNVDDLLKQLSDKISESVGVADDKLTEEKRNKKSQALQGKLSELQNKLSLKLIDGTKYQNELLKLQAKYQGQVNSATESELAAALQSADLKARAAVAEKFGLKTRDDLQKEIEKERKAQEKATREVEKSVNTILQLYTNEDIDIATSRRRLEKLARDNIGKLPAAIQAQLDSEIEGARILEEFDNQAKKAVEAQKAQIKALRAVTNEIFEQRNITANIMDKARKTQENYGNMFAATKDIPGFSGINKAVATLTRAINSVAQKYDVAGSNVRIGATGPEINPGRGGSGKLVIQSPRDIQRFTNALSVGELSRFGDSLLGIKNNMTQARAQTLNFISSISSNTDTIRKLNDAFVSTTNSAYRFGEQAARSASRLLSWVAPANFIFLTVSKLRQAVGEIIDLDKQARRLIFFQSAGNLLDISGIENAAARTQRFSETTEEATDRVNKFTQALRAQLSSAAAVSSQIDGIVNAASEYGVTIKDATDAFITIARTGQQLTNKLNDTRSTILDSTLSLVRLENGALGAEEAVRGLQAIQAQFFGGKTGSVYGGIADSAIRASIASESLRNATALLAATSATSSAKVSELIDATTRLGSAFANIQGLNFAQTVGIVGEAFTQTGATTGRISTALRQVATLITKNAKEIEEFVNAARGGTGEPFKLIEDGQIRDFSAVLDILKQIKDTQGTVGATELSLLIADQRNLADVQALAAGVDRLSATYEQFGNLSQRLAIVGEAVRANFAQNASLAESLEAKINRLNAEIVKFTEAASANVAIKLAVDSFTSLVGLSTSVAKNAESLKAILIAVAAVAAGKLATAAASFARGFIDSISNAGKFSQSLESIRGRIGDIKTEISAINELRVAGLITPAGERDAIKEIVATRLESNSLLSQAADIQLRINELDKSDLDFTDEIVKLEQQRAQIADDIAAGEQRVLAAKRKVVAEAQAQVKREREVARARALAGAGATFAVGIANTVAPESEVTKVLNSALGAGLAFGTAGGPLAGLIAGISAGIVTGVNSGIAKVQASTKKVNESLISDEGRLLGIKEQIFTLTKVDKNLTKSLNQDEKDRIKAVGTEAAKLKERVDIIKESVKQTGYLSDDEAERLAIYRAQGVELQNELAFIQKSAQERQNGANISKLARKLDEENARLAKVLTDENSSQADKLAAKAKIESNNKKLAEEQYELALKQLNVQERINAATATYESRLLQIDAIAKKRDITRDIAKRLSQFSASQTIELDLDAEQVASQIEAIQEKISAATVRASEDSEFAKGVDKEIAALRAQQQEAALSLIPKLADAQQKLLDKSTEAVNKQISAWESASKDVTAAFSQVISEQLRLSDIYKNIGSAVASNIEKAGTSSLNSINAGGTNLASKLSKVANTYERIQAVTTESANKQLSTLGDRFSSVGNVSGAVDSLLARISAAVSNSQFSGIAERDNVVKASIAIAKQQLSDEKAIFKQRLDETRREISIKKELLAKEIEIITKRQEAEQKLNDEIRKNSAEVGRLLIDSPKKFKETVNSISSARKFFKDVTSINVNSLQTIQKRLAKARDAGEPGQQAIREIFEGIQNATKFGAGQLVQGLDNTALADVFARVGVEGAERLSADLDKQRIEAQKAAEAQKQVQLRQDKQIALMELDASIQRELIRLNQAEANFAAQQRNVQATKMDELISTNEKSNLEMYNVLQAILAVQSGQLTKTQKDNLKGTLSPQIIEALNRTQRGNKSANASDDKRLGSIFGFTNVGERLLGIINSQFSKSDIAVALEDEARRKLLDSQSELAIKTRQVTENIAKSGTGLQEFITKITGVKTEKPKESVSLSDRAAKLRSQISTRENSFGRFSPVDRIREIESRAREGQQLTADEQSQINKLKSRFNQTGLNATTEAGGRRIARRLFKDNTSQDEILNSIRDTFGNKVNGQDFGEGLRRLRGEGARGSRNIDVGATKDFFKNAGLFGAADSINTKGQAEKVLDQFIKLSEALSKEQGDISSATREKVVEVLGRELTVGVQETLAKEREARIEALRKREQEEAENRKKEEERKRKEAAKLVESIAGSAAKATSDAISVGVKDASDKIAAIGPSIARAIEDGLDAVEITVRPGGKLEAGIEISFTDALKLDTEVLARALKNAIGPVLAGDQRLDVLSDAVIKVLDELVRRGFPEAVRIKNAMNSANNTGPVGQPIAPPVPARPN